MVGVRTGRLCDFQKREINTVPFLDERSANKRTSKFVLPTATLQHLQQNTTQKQTQCTKTFSTQLLKFRSRQLQATRAPRLNDESNE